MRRQILTSILAVIVCLVGMTGCSSDDETLVTPPLDLTTLDTQAKVDAFGDLGHVDYAEHLIIGSENTPNSSITNLDGLRGLVSVKGLTVYFNDELVNLNGLEDLKTIGSDGLVIEVNPKLESVGGSAFINRNGTIGEVGGLENLTTIGGYLVIEENPNLANMQGLMRLASVGGDAFINMNGIMGNLDGLENLATIGGNLAIEENPKLTNVQGLLGLTSIGGDAFIGMNGIIGSLAGLNSVTSIGGALGITNNPALVSMDGFRNLETVGGTVLIDQNAAVTNLWGLSKLSSVGGGLWMLNNPELTDFCGVQHLVKAGFNGSYSAVGNAWNPSLAEIDAMFCDTAKNN